MLKIASTGGILFKRNETITVSVKVGMENVSEAGSPYGLSI